MKNEFLGLHYLIDGFRIIFKPGLKRFTLIPLLINVILFIGLFAVFKYFFAEFNHWLINFLPHWLQWLGSFLWIFFFIGFLFMMSYTFVTLANIVAAPFHSFLAENVEFYLTGKKLEQGYIESFKNIPRSIGRQLSILGYYLPRALFLLFLFFIPVIQIIAAPLWFLFNAWFMTLQSIDYVTDNNRIALNEVQMQLRRKRLLGLTFGVGVLVLAMIPVVNFFVIPAAVAGATKMWLDEFGSELSKSMTA